MAAESLSTEHHGAPSRSRPGGQEHSSLATAGAAALVWARRRRFPALCSPLAGRGFVLDGYTCRCRAGFYHPDRVAVNGFATPASGPNADEGSSSDCLPCQPGCSFCRDETPCVTRPDGALRWAVVSSQCLCMLIVFVSMVLVYHFRRNKSIRASGLVLLEAILCGALLLYFPTHFESHGRRAMKRDEHPRVSLDTELANGPRSSQNKRHFFSFDRSLSVVGFCTVTNPLDWIL
ncbi:putative G-protein coupled receptor 158 [Liparis tanakae]|uniref:Putative G-protein coupled receptor 158 n=1 Tax=Liparis tanakae TaxID=230148 RepID=A0A4Z2GWP9_9TELE|nr:putative G-protein coupled receptor 158 [Liparis tanakae]